MRHLETQQAIASAPDETRQVRKCYSFFYRETSRYGNLIAWQTSLKLCLYNAETYLLLSLEQTLQAWLDRQAVAGLGRDEKYFVHYFTGVARWSNCCGRGIVFYSPIKENSTEK